MINGGMPRIRKLIRRQQQTIRGRLRKRKLLHAKPMREGRPRF
jgi:hypothetical protein